MSQKIKVLKLSLFSLMIALGSQLKAEYNVSVNIKNDTGGGTSTGNTLYAAYFQVQGATTDGDNKEKVTQVSSLQTIGRGESKTISATINPPGKYGKNVFGKRGHEYSYELYISTTGSSNLFPKKDNSINKGDAVAQNTGLTTTLFIPVVYRGQKLTDISEVTVSTDSKNNLFFTTNDN